MSSKEKKKSISDMIKETLQNAGKGGWGDNFYLKDGDNKRVRFLTDLDELIVISFHSSKYGAKKEEKYQHPCLHNYDKECDKCDSPKDERYAGTLYNFETKKREFFVFKANKCTPIPNMATYFDNYGTLTDRDYSIGQMGSESNKNITMIPNDRGKFKVKDIVPFTEEEIFEMIKADKFMFDLGEDVTLDDIEDLDAKPKKSKKKKAVEDDDDDEEEEVAPPKKKKKVVEVVEEDEDEEDEEDDDDDDEEEAPPPPKKKKKK